MTGTTEIDPGTLEAYCRADYRISGQWSLRIDQPCVELLAWHRHFRVECSAFLTAFNPRSRLLAIGENLAAHERLRAALVHSRHPFAEGSAADPAGAWPDEQGFLVAGLARGQARALGSCFDQNAVVWSGADAVPRLILLC